MCTEAVGTMIDYTYELGPSAREGVPAETTMHDIVGWIPNNHGNRNASQLEDFGEWFPKWLKAFGYDKKIHLNAYVHLTFSSIQTIINAQHVAVGGFNDYVSLRLADGSNPYKWNDPHGLGHVLLIVGYDTDKQTVVVHDPLRADPDGQPADYTWAGFQAAKFASLTEVVGPALSYSVNTAAGPAPAPTPVVPDLAAQLADALKQLAAEQAANKAWEQWYAALQTTMKTHP